MQEPLTVIVIALVTIAVATALAVFGIRIKHSRHKVVVDNVPDPAFSPTLKEIDTAIPQADSSDSPAETIHRAKQGEPLEQGPPERGSIVSIIYPISEFSSTPAPVPNEDEQKVKQETINCAEPETTEPPIDQIAEPPENSPSERTQQVEETTAVLPGLETPVTHEPTPTQNRRKLAPGDRGGARRGKRTKELQEGPSEKTERLGKPELICWQQSRKWFLGIELPQDYGDASQIKVTQANIELKIEGNSRLPISTFFGSVSIEPHLVSERYQLPIAQPENPFLLFKLSGQSLRSGRRIRRATTGTYLVVAPDSWIRNEELSGVAQIPAERCHLNGFSAHFFHLDSAEDSRIVFFAPGNELIEIPNGNSQFKLVGLKIDDASDEMGPLFGLGPPSIHSIDAKGWKNVETIVIGEEGEQRTGWRTSFHPDVETESINLTPYLAGKAGGWFFVRIYDATEGPPIESLDFRFLRNLQAINVDHHNALPMETGHKPITVSIKWNGPERGELLSDHSKPIPTEVNGLTARIEIPPKPDVDKTEWILESPVNTRVGICLQMERVWWTVCERNSSSDTLTWHDKPILLSRDNCTATSKQQLRIRFPKRRWTKELRAGFQQERARTYRVVVTQQIVDIPLNHFEGVGQLENFSEDHLLSLWLDGFPEQIIAILPVQSERDNRPRKHRDSPPIRLNLRRLLKYLTNLDRAARDASLSELLKECRQNWLSPGVRAQRKVYLLQTACVIIVSWRVIKIQGKKPAGRRKGWIRAILRLAETSPASLLATSERYERLSHGTNNVSSD